MDTYTTRKFVSLSVLAAAVVIGGCKNSESANVPSPFINGQFRSDDEPRAVDNLMARQTANGARDDATLYPQHFTNGKLNGLGYAKLSAMTDGPQTGKLAIYLDVPKGETFFACQDSVMKTLAHGGIDGSTYTITAGGNPGVSTPAAQGLAGLAKQSGGVVGGAGPEAAAK